MSTQELAEAVMELPEKDRLELARRIVAGIVAERDTAGAIAQAVQGIEEVVTGKVRGLSEAEFPRRSPMRVSYHPGFPKDIKRFEAQYLEVSERLALRFRAAVDDAIEQIKASPASAGHFVNTGSKIVKEVRRRNLSSFPAFILYGVSGDLLVFRSLIASASDPLTWLKRLPKATAGEPPERETN